MDPFLLEALREVDRIAPAAPNVAPTEELAFPSKFANEVMRIVEIPARPEPPPLKCVRTDLVDAVDCPHCMEQRRFHIRALMARAHGWQ